jgi:hypothetical protein
MAKSNTPPPSTNSGGFQNMSFGRKVLIFLILLIILSFLLDKLGVPIVHRSEKEELIEHPHR